MSEQNKSNVQALGAGVLGFVAVVAVGGGALMLHSSHQAKSGGAPASAAAPIDLGSSMPRPSMQAAGAQKERRAQSPAPLMGEPDEASSSEAPAASAPAAAPAASPASSRAADLSPESAPAAKAAALEVASHLDASGSGSSAEATVKNTLAAKEPAKLAARKTSKTKLEVPVEGAVASTVHYGVTSRNELMGRAAGPVYNIKGGKTGDSNAAAGKLAADADGKIADIRRQLAASGLPAEQRAKLLKDLDDSLKRVSETGKTAQ